MPFVQTSEKRELRKVTKNKANQHTADMFCKPPIAFSAQESKNKDILLQKFGTHRKNDVTLHSQTRKRCIIVLLSTAP